MESKKGGFEEKLELLNRARRLLLGLHKVLIDIERRKFENEKGQTSSGQFLQVLLNDENFCWLRKFSTLIVEIDEMLDLDDGFTGGMVDDQLLQIHSLLVFENSDIEFNSKYLMSIQSNSEVEIKHNELKKLFG